MVIYYRFSSDSTVNTFLHTKSSVYHIEPDDHIRGNILFSDKCSLKTTDGIVTTTIVGDALKCDYVEGVGTEARFSAILGFLQISKTQVVVADYDFYCLRMIDRNTLRTSPYLGSCYDITSNIKYPRNIISDCRQPTMLFVSDRYSLYHLNTSTSPPRIHETFSVSGWYMAQDSRTGDLYIAEGSHVTKLVYSTKQMLYIAGSPAGFKDGGFSSTEFYSLREIAYTGNYQLFVADWGNHRLRLLDMNLNITSSICSGIEGSQNGNLTSCALRQPRSLLAVNNTLFIGEDLSIRVIEGELQS